MSKKHKKYPKDLKVEIGSKEQVIFTELANATKIMIEDGEKALTANKAILAMSERIIAEEKAKFK